MYSYIIGKIVSLNKKTITIENNYFGYCLYVSRPEEYEIGKIKKIYLYKSVYLNNKNKVVEELYGFGEYEEKEFFLSLLAIQGIGPKTAIGICHTKNNILKEVILKKDYDTLVNFPNITSKIAHALIDELVLEVNEENQLSNRSYISDMVKALSSLGYDKKVIAWVSNEIDCSKYNDISDVISDAVKKISNYQNGVLANNESTTN